MRYISDFSKTYAVNIHGEFVERTIDEYPYSFDPFLIWKGDYKETDTIVYSDRLYQWNSKKFNDSYGSLWGSNGQSFSNKSPEEIEKFLSLYYGDNIILTGIEYTCNFSTGFPIWVFYFRSKE